MEVVRKFDRIDVMIRFQFNTTSGQEELLDHLIELLWILLLDVVTSTVIHLLVNQFHFYNNLHWKSMYSTPLDVGLEVVRVVFGHHWVSVSMKNEYRTLDQRKFFFHDVVNPGRRPGNTQVLPKTGQFIPIDLE